VPRRRLPPLAAPDAPAHRQCERGDTSSDCTSTIADDRETSANGYDEISRSAPSQPHRFVAAASVRRSRIGSSQPHRFVAAVSVRRSRSS
jgi:hypothetical protein